MAEYHALNYCGDRDCVICSPKRKAKNPADDPERKAAEKAYNDDIASEGGK